MAKYCGNCGAEVDDHSNYCPSCGAPLSGNARSLSSDANNKPDHNTARPVAIAAGTVVDMSFLSRLFRRSRSPSAEPPIPPRVRLYEAGLARGGRR